MLNLTLFQNLGNMWLWVPVWIKGDGLSTQYLRETGCQFLCFAVVSHGWGCLPCTSISMSGSKNKKDLLLPLSIWEGIEEMRKDRDHISCNQWNPFFFLSPPASRVRKLCVQVRLFSRFGQPVWCTDRLADKWCWGPTVRVLQSPAGFTF